MDEQNKTEHVAKNSLYDSDFKNIIEKPKQCCQPCQSVWNISKRNKIAGFTGLWLSSWWEATSQRHIQHINFQDEDRWVLFSNNRNIIIVIKDLP